jgi:heat shock protein HspQ
MGFQTAMFSIGDVVEHRLFGYRGVVVDVDPCFALSEEWYENVARSRPPKDAPWYHVLVHDSDAPRYVAQQNLRTDPSGLPVHNPDLSTFFDEFAEGRYVRSTPTN